MDNKDRKLIEWAAKTQLKEIISQSKIIHERLSFREHLKLYSEVDQMTYKESVELLIKEDIKEFESKFKKFLKYSLAALVAMKYGGAKTITGTLFGAPAVGMFILYLFRKLTDSCSRVCMDKIPLSNARKICQLECKVEAVKKLTDQLRTEIGKCGQFGMLSAHKCEKKLRKQYIKWAKKLQELIIRLRTAKVDVEAQERKKRQKELDKTRGQIVRSGYELERNIVLNFILENKDLRSKLAFEEHLELYDKVLDISSSELLELLANVVEKDEPHVKPPSIDPKKEQTFRRVIYLGLWVLPVPFFNDFINYLLKKYNYACLAKCLNKPNVNKEICYKQCRYLSTKMSVDFLEKQMGSCDKHKKPTKCKKKILKLLSDWKQRQVDAQVKYEGSLRKQGVV